MIGKAFRKATNISMVVVEKSANAVEVSSVATPSNAALVRSTNVAIMLDLKMRRVFHFMKDMILVVCAQEIN